MMKLLKSEKNFDICFSEVDSMGIVWHGSYAFYLEDAREQLARIPQRRNIEGPERHRPREHPSGPASTGPRVAHSGGITPSATDGPPSPPCANFRRSHAEKSALKRLTANMQQDTLFAIPPHQTQQHLQHQPVRPRPDPPKAFRTSAEIAR